MLRKIVVKQVVRENGRIDILVNNAGVISCTPVHELELEEWHHLIAVDQKGVMLDLKHTITQMLKQNSDAMVNESSIWGTVNIWCYTIQCG